MARTMQGDRCRFCDASSSIGYSVFFANRIVGEPSAAGNLNTWPARREARYLARYAPKSIKVNVSESVEAPKLIEVGRAGSVQAAKIGRTCAWAAPRSIQGCAAVSKIDTQSRPGATNARGRTHSSFANHRRGDISTNWVDFRRCRHACEPSKVPCLPAKSKVRHIALHDELLGRCYFEKQ